MLVAAAHLDKLIELIKTCATILDRVSPKIQLLGYNSPTSFNRGGLTV
jgi:hypothetical protein